MSGAGETGPRGETGGRGPQGEPGPKGEPGRSPVDPSMTVDYGAAVEAITRPSLAMNRKIDRTRMALWWVGAVLAVAVAGAVFAIAGLVRANADRDHIAAVAQQAQATAVQEAADAHAARVSQCESGNTFRAADLKRWTELIAAATPAKGATPAQSAAASQLRMILFAPDTPNDCTDLP